MFHCTDGDGAGAQDGASAHGVGQSDENEEVMRALLIHEKRNVAGGGAGGANAAAAATAATRGLTANASDSDSDTSESDDEPPANPVPVQHRAEQQQEEEDDDDDFEEVTDGPMVMVGGRPYSCLEVSQRPELVAQMSAQEKEAYIEMGKTLYQDMYD